MKTLSNALILLVVFTCGIASAQKPQEKEIDFEKAYEKLLKDPKTKAEIEAKGASKEDVIAWLKQQAAKKKKPEASQPVGTKKKVDWDTAYEALLKKRPDIRKKVESGGTTKEQVIAWMKSRFGEGKKAESNPGLAEFRKKLDGMVKKGKLTKKEADALYQTMASKTAPAKKKPEVNLQELRTKLTQAVKNGKMTAAEAKAAYRKAAAAGGKGKGGKGKGKAGSGNISFYAIVIGKLKTKDVELGEFTLEVDHVTSMYANRWVKDEIVGKTIKVTGVSGAFRDNLLLMKRGQTLKFRSGNYQPKSNTMTFGVKFHVLERAKEFKPADYGVPPQEFRGFQGVLEGKILEVGGFEVLLEVSKATPSSESKAKDASVIQGKRVRIVGFFNQHAKAFEDLQLGDAIRVSVRHSDPTFDEFQVTKQLDKK